MFCYKKQSVTLTDQLLFVSNDVSSQFYHKFLKNSWLSFILTDISAVKKHLIAEAFLTLLFEKRGAHPQKPIRLESLLLSQACLDNKKQGESESALPLSLAVGPLLLLKG